MVYCCFHVWIFALNFFNTEFCIRNADIYKYAYVLNYIGQMKFFFVANAWQNNVLALLFCVISKQRVAHTYTHQPAWITHINQNKTISFHLLTLGFFACPYLLFLFRAGGRVSIHMIHSIRSAFLVRILFLMSINFQSSRKKNNVETEMNSLQTNTKYMILHRCWPCMVWALSINLQAYLSLTIGAINDFNACEKLILPWLCLATWLCLAMLCSTLLDSSLIDSAPLSVPFSRCSHPKSCSSSTC